MITSSGEYLLFAASLEEHNRDLAVFYPRPSILKARGPARDLGTRFIDCVTTRNAAGLAVAGLDETQIGEIRLNTTRKLVTPTKNHDNIPGLGLVGGP